MRNDLAVKWLSLISIKFEQASKICSHVKRLSHPMHIGGSSPFNKKEWVRKEWPMCNRAITVSSFLFVRGQNIHSFNAGNILYNLFSGNWSHSDGHSSNIYLFVRGFKTVYRPILRHTQEKMEGGRHKTRWREADTRQDGGRQTDWYHVYS